MVRRTLHPIQTLSASTALPQTTMAVLPPVNRVKNPRTVFGLRGTATWASAIVETEQAVKNASANSEVLVVKGINCPFVRTSAPAQASF
jgi:hypothetical protein